MSNISGKAILLTGATSGIGRALALRLSSEGARLAVCGRSPEKMASLLDAITTAGGMPPLHATFDLASEQEILAFIERANADLGCLDILINNAGVNITKAPVSEIQTDHFDAMLAVNLRAPMIFMREAFRLMSARGEGHVVNILSSACLYSNETMGAYTAGKAGLDALTRIFRKECQPHGIRVTAIYPGGTNTPFRAKPRPDYMAAESVAEAIVGLLNLPGDVVPHEFVFRPEVEVNYP